MKDHSFYMRKAIALAQTGKNTPGGGAFGAVIVHEDGPMIAAVHNAVGATADCTQHAELRAVQEACGHLGSKDLSGCILYTSCEPCLMCLGACYWANFKAIYFGASAADAKAAGYVYSALYYDADPSLRHSSFKMEQLLRDEAVAVWQ
jgi:tRNA(Arg) A34 adenosine deaminase TadA